MRPPFVRWNKLSNKPLWTWVSSAIPLHLCGCNRQYIPVVYPTASLYSLMPIKTQFSFNRGRLFTSSTQQENKDDWHVKIDEKLSYNNSAIHKNKHWLPYLARNDFDTSIFLNAIFFNKKKRKIITNLLSAGRKPSELITFECLFMRLSASTSIVRAWIANFLSANHNNPERNLTAFSSVALY